jgi:biotin carboxylase
MGKRIAILSNTPHQRQLIDTALQLGFDPVVVQEEELAAAGFDGVVPVPEPAAVVSGAAARIYDKVTLRRALGEHGIQQPEYSVVETERDGVAAAARIGATVVVQPSRGYGGRGVHLVRHPEDVPLAIKQAWRYGGDGQILVERWVPGDKLCADAVLENGVVRLQGIIQELFGDIYCTAWAAITFSELTAHAEQLSEAIGKACAAIGFPKGFVHAEFGLEQGELSLIRLAPYPSCYRYPVDLHKLAGGTDLLAQCILTAAGEETRAPEFAKQGVALVWLKAGSGVVQGVTGLDDARNAPGIIQVEVFANKGDIIGHPADRVARDRLGYVVAAGETAGEALERAQDAASLCKILTSPNL